MHRTSLIAGLILIALSGAAIRFVMTTPDPEPFEFVIPEEGSGQIVLSGRDLDIAARYVSALQERDNLNGDVITGGGLVVLVVGGYLVVETVTSKRKKS